MSGTQHEFQGLSRQSSLQVCWNVPKGIWETGGILLHRAMLLSVGMRPMHDGGGPGLVNGGGGAVIYFTLSPSPIYAMRSTRRMQMTYRPSGGRQQEGMDSSKV